MESILEIIFSAENIRMLVLLAFGFSAYVLMNKRIDEKIDGVKSSLLHAMDEKINTFHAHLKANDFAHLNNTIVSLNTRLNDTVVSLNTRLNDTVVSLNARLNDTIMALTFTLEKNKFLEKEDKKYIDGRLG